MWSQGFSFMEREQKRFISYSLNNGDILVKTELEMLKNNNISGILPVSEIHDNNNVVLLYNITSKQQFTQRMSGVFSGEQLYKMLVSICKTILILDEYMINPGHLILEMEYMCFDYEKNEAQFMVLPVKDIKKVPDIHKFLTDIFNILQYSDNALREFPNYIYDYVRRSPKTDIKDFKKFLEDTYNTFCGVIQPIEPELPEPAVNYNKEKEIIDTDEVKKTVQSRFITQSEKILEFENITENKIKTSNIPKPGKDNNIMSGVTPGSFSVPTPKGAFMTPPAKEKKRKEKPVKKQKEKPVKKKKVKEKKVKENKEEKPKEKKSLFSFVKRNKTETADKQTGIMPPPLPVIQPVENANNIKVPVNNMPPFASSIQKPAQNMPPFASSIQKPPVQNTQSFVNTIKKPLVQDTPQFTNGFNGLPVQDVHSSFANTPVQNMQTFVNNIQDVQQISGEDLDSTVLLDTGKIIIKPVLRSKVTGEVIKIEKPGFIIGRNKIANGKLVKMPDGQNPDVSINIKSISHTHAVFLWHDNRWYIKDTDSLNGTFVNGDKLACNQEIALNEGDTVCFASEEYEFIFIK